MRDIEELKRKHDQWAELIINGMAQFTDHPKYKAWYDENAAIIDAIGEDIDRLFLKAQTNKS